MASKSKCLEGIENERSEEQTERSIFSPPLYIQRYLMVVKFIENNKDSISKIVDVGCNNLSFFRYLKNFSNIQEIILMDLDEDLLQDNIWKVKTIPYDYLSKRKNPLSVHIISADVKIPDYSLPDVDLLTMIEVIEHLYEDELPSLVINVFQVIQPKYVFVSTPNAEYNKFFPGFKSGQFRHPDHKFEWDSSQFQQWALLIGVNHFYDVEFDGCGIAEGLFCTQVAVFTRQALPKNKSENNKKCKGNTTKVLHIENYPYYQITPEEELQNKILVSFQRLFSSLLEIVNTSDMISDHIFYKMTTSSSETSNKWDELLQITETQSAEGKNKKHNLSFTLQWLNEINSTIFKLEKNIFYYIKCEDLVIFLVDTFCSWLEENHPYDFLMKLLQAHVILEDINGQRCMKIFMYDTDECVY